MTFIRHHIAAVIVAVVLAMFGVVWLGTAWHVSGQTTVPTICHSHSQHRCLWIEGSSTWQP